ncbi:hypothetical protein [Microaceticoccus formicicus]|uniref:hypothetical protein n=1 Tax=Microaceticoccus formicicus TaxID=3118105 RepID=UPI003CD021C4|nr:hypothetical protein VZL98_01660 [Peptoniphilaceae bacterium AMB_02]
MKVKALIEFNDYKENVTRKIGEEFVVSKERLAEITLASKNYGNGKPWVELIEEPKPKQTKTKR